MTLFHFLFQTRFAPDRIRRGLNSVWPSARQRNTSEPPRSSFSSRRSCQLPTGRTRTAKNVAPPRRFRFPQLVGHLDRKALARGKRSYLESWARVKSRFDNFLPPAKGNC